MDSAVETKSMATSGPAAVQALRWRYAAWVILAAASIVAVPAVLVCGAVSDPPHIGKLAAIFIVAAAFASPALIWRAERARQRLRDRFAELKLCPRCGYDLRATPRVCPECGSAFRR